MVALFPFTMMLSTWSTTGFGTPLSEGNHGDTGYMSTQHSLCMATYGCPIWFHVFLQATDTLKELTLAPDIPKMYKQELLVQ